MIMVQGNWDIPESGTVDAYKPRQQAAGQPYYFRPQKGPGDIIYDDMGMGYVSGTSQTYIGNPWPDMTLASTECGMERV